MPNTKIQNPAKGSPDRIVGRCPQCGSANIAGLVASFFALLDDSGQLLDDWRSLESETELTPQRNCADCGHDWESD